MKPILFSTDMVRAILDGRKTQTRRIIKHPGALHFLSEKADLADVCQSYAPYLPNDILYVRETFVYRSKHDRFYYKADYPNFELYAHGGWKPSIHMPKEAARIFLKVTAVKAEHLQEISEADAIAEGVEWFIPGGEWGQMNGKKVFKKYPHDFSKGCGYGTAKDSFESLWHQVYGSESWDENPYVFAYTFERIEKPTSNI